MESRELIRLLEERLGPAFEVTRVQSVSAGSKGYTYEVIWARVGRESLREAVTALKECEEREGRLPHLAVISAADLGESIELVYHFELGWGRPRAAVPLNLSVTVPKEDPRVPSLSDLLPGAFITEREKEEMIGVVVDGLPETGNLFLPEDFPAGVYPWRKDEHGVQSLLRELE
ncbi:MAG: NADH-quinone oxidoreductase subunit C [Clostridia bacterium]|jgi:membrane-bound hydrogenase subunit beta|nr:NADH-quinone oxidoreductase subunit C [Clostridia bacterium]MDH7573018.1 NADH-quinone oxidoreductase subunit C [Clostridia bacterium]